ncbi:hypothetical protein JS82_00585 [Methanomassiliicoccaceae archaeon DOK]|nr:hypothetical protein JS82_00585 [Methanomassiliicoccaceae archaeon DOK]
MSGLIIKGKLDFEEASKFARDYYDLYDVPLTEEERRAVEMARHRFPQMFGKDVSDRQCLEILRLEYRDRKDHGPEPEVTAEDRAMIGRMRGKYPDMFDDGMTENEQADMAWGIYLLREGRA